MERNRSGAAVSGRGKGVSLILFVAGRGHYSRTAEENLRDIAAAEGIDARIEVVDVRVDPERAMAEKIFLTPALVVRKGRQSLLVMGDLSERDKVVGALRSLR
jgi:hypothetical protein